MKINEDALRRLTLAFGAMTDAFGQMETAARQVCEKLSPPGRGPGFVLLIH